MTNDTETSSHNNQQDDSSNDDHISVDEVEMLTNQLKRAQADFVNFKNRTERDQAQFVHMTMIELLSHFLPILDSLKRAVAHVPEKLQGDEWVKGVLQTIVGFEMTVQQMGVETIPTIGEKVNPEIHEVVAQGDGEKDIIIEEVEAGYRFREKTIRPAKVKVGNGSE